MKYKEGDIVCLYDSKRFMSLLSTTKQKSIRYAILKMKERYLMLKKKRFI